MHDANARYYSRCPEERVHHAAAEYDVYGSENRLQRREHFTLHPLNTYQKYLYEYLS